MLNMLIQAAQPIEQLAAEQFASQPSSPEITGFLQPLMEIIKPALGTLSAVVGGLFGLYLIFIIARLYYEKRKTKLLKDVRYDLDYLNQHFNLPYSQEKKPLKLHKVMPLEEFKRLEEAGKRKIEEKEKLIKKKERENKKKNNLKKK